METCKRFWPTDRQVNFRRASRFVPAFAKAPAGKRPSPLEPEINPAFHTLRLRDGGAAPPTKKRFVE